MYILSSVSLESPSLMPLVAKQHSDILIPVHSLVESVFRCPPSPSFLGHCIYSRSKSTKASFCNWLRSFWFGFSERTITGTTVAQQCTFHTTPAKSCKRNWFWEPGISPGVVIWNHISCSICENNQRQRPGHTFKFGCLIIQTIYLMLNPAPDNSMSYCPAKDVCNLSKLLCFVHANSSN